MVVTAAAEKTVNKIQHSFMIKAIHKIGIEGIYLNIIKSIYGKPTANIILNDEELKVLPLRSGTRQWNPFSLLLFNIVLEVLTIAIRQEEERKGIQIRKDVKLSLFSDNTTLYTEKSLRTTRELLKLMNEFSKDAESKISIQKSVAFWYTSNELSETEIKTIPLKLY